MNKITIKLETLFTLMLTLAMLVPSADPVRAQGLENNAGSGTQLFCKRDFSNFLTNGLDFDGEGFLDYWTDILDIPGVGYSRYSTNYCRFMDIDSLLNRIDKARKQIRQAFYVCDNKTTTTVSAQYYELSAELYYLRHFVDTAPSANPKNGEEEKKQKVARKNDVRAKFMDLFVNKMAYFDQQQAATVFEKLFQKYESKIESYRNCTDPNLEQLMDRINNFGSTIDTINNLGKRFAEKASKRWSAMKTRVKENPGLATVFSSKGLGDFFNRVVDLRVNAEPAQEATVWESISNTAKENAPFSYGEGKAALPAITFQSVSADMNTIQDRDRTSELDLEYVTNYDLKYRQVQGLGLDKLKSNLDDLQTIIKDTFTPLTRVEKCTANILGKQCSNKPAPAAK